MAASVGGGVAALEALLALRALAEERVEIDLIAPEPVFTYRPLAVAEPFGIGQAHRYDLVKVVQDHGAVLHLAGVHEIRPSERRLVTWDGRSLGYELLLLAVGARPAVGIPGSVSITGPGYTGRFRTVLRELEERRIQRVAFAVPAATTWPLPLYARLGARRPGADRQLGTDRGAAPGRGVDLKPAAHERHSLPHPDQPEPAVRMVWIKALPVVGTVRPMLSGSSTISTEARSAPACLAALVSAS
jgi:hypothetical protein